MKDKDRVKLKAQDILRKELSAEEFLMITSIQVRESDEDKQKAQLDKAVVEELARMLRAEQVAKEQMDLQRLAEFIGLPMLPPNDFTLSISKFYNGKGTITEAQRKALLANYS